MSRSAPGDAIFETLNLVASEERLGGTVVQVLCILMIHSDPLIRSKSVGCLVKIETTLKKRGGSCFAKLEECVTEHGLHLAKSTAWILDFRRTNTDC